jgi:hypothetical protein
VRGSGREVKTAQTRPMFRLKPRIRARRLTMSSPGLRSAVRAGDFRARSGGQAATSRGPSRQFGRQHVHVALGRANLGEAMRRAGLPRAGRRTSSQTPIETTVFTELNAGRAISSRAWFNQAPSSIAGDSTRGSVTLPSDRSSRALPVSAESPRNRGHRRRAGRRRLHCSPNKRGRTFGGASP